MLSATSTYSQQAIKEVADIIGKLSRTLSGKGEAKIPSTEDDLGGSATFEAETEVLKVSWHLDHVPATGLPDGSCAVFGDQMFGEKSTLYDRWSCTAVIRKRDGHILSWQEEPRSTRDSLFAPVSWLFGKLYSLCAHDSTDSSCVGAKELSPSHYMRALRALEALKRSDEELEFDLRTSSF